MMKLKITTSSSCEFKDITRVVKTALAENGVEEGVCHLFCPHTTCALTINENADPDVLKDLKTGYTDMVKENLPYRHAEGNSTAHIKTAMTGNSLAVFIENSELTLGTWQGIYLCEFDGPREREVWLKVIKG